MIDINVQEPLLVRRNCISSFPADKVSIHCPSRSAFLRTLKGNYLWDLVDTGSIQITPPFSICTLFEHNLLHGEGLIVTLDNLLAVTSTSFPKAIKIFDKSSFIDGRHIFYRIKGPAYVVLFGAGEVTRTEVVEPMKLRRGTVIAYSDTLSYGVGLSNLSYAHAISQNHVLEDTIDGVGVVFRQTSALGMSQIASAESKSSNTFIDYLNAVIGIK